MKEASVPRDKRNAVASWTGGKDGCLSCYKAIRDGYDVTHILHFRNIGRQGSHDIDRKLLHAQAEAMDIPIISREFHSYEVEFKSVIEELRGDGVRIDGAVFGHIQTHKGLVDRICDDLGLELILPLWKTDSRQIIGELLDHGFEVILASVKASHLGEEWLGRAIDEEFIDDLRQADTRIDPCGEDGEFHTFVTDCPLFKHSLVPVGGEKVLKDGYWFWDFSDVRAKKKDPGAH